MVLSKIATLSVLQACSQLFFTFYNSKKGILQEIQICSINLPAACVPRAAKDNSTRITRASVIASFSHNNTAILKLKHARCSRISEDRFTLTHKAYCCSQKRSFRFHWQRKYSVINHSSCDSHIIRVENSFYRSCSHCESRELHGNRLTDTTHLKLIVQTFGAERYS